MKSQITEFEKKYNLRVPVEYKSCEIIFGLSSLTLEYYDEQEDFFFRATKWLAFTNKNGLELKIDSFFTQCDLNEIWERHVKLWGNPIQFLPIGFTSNPSNGLILISVREIDYGQIWYTKYGERQPLYLDENLSNFLLSLEQVIKEDKKDITSRLYKNYNESYWRLKELDKPI